MKRKKTIGAIIASFILVGAGAVFYLVFFTTPRMKVQEHIRAFEATMPDAPEMSVPLKGKPAITDRITIPEINPDTLSRSEQIRMGKAYYSYYCLFCHGERGEGEGPVGQSYMPRPSNLRTEQVKNMADKELLMAMLLGTGHEPVINRVVPRQSYIPLLQYVRSLDQEYPTNTNLPN